MFHQTQTARRPAKGPKMPFLSLVTVTLTYDLGIQTCPSKWPNTSSLWICPKSVQRFPEIFHTQTKKSQTAPKTEPYAMCGRKLNLTQINRNTQYNHRKATSNQQTTVRSVHNTAQNRPDNFSSYPPDNHHCSDDVYLREGGSGVRQ